MGSNHEPMNLFRRSEFGSRRTGSTNTFCAEDPGNDSRGFSRIRVGFPSIQIREQEADGRHGGGKFILAQSHNNDEWMEGHKT